MLCNTSDAINLSCAIATLVGNVVEVQADCFCKHRVFPCDGVSSKVFSFILDAIEEKAERENLNLDQKQLDELRQSLE